MDININQNKFLKWAVILGIVIVLNLFFAYALKVAYNEPKYDDFCEDRQVIEQINNQEECIAEGGQWNQNIKERDYNEEGKPIPPNMITDEGYCNQNYDCSNTYRDARELYEKNVFMTLIVLGVISIVIGFMMASQAVISVAFPLGGILTFIWASMRYWQFASEFLQVGILGLALLVLIYLGVKKIK